MCIRDSPYDFVELHDDAISLIRGVNLDWIGYEFCCPHAFQDVYKRQTQETPSQIRLYLHDDNPATNGYRTVDLGGDHPYVSGGMPIDVSGVGFGQNEGFAFQARAFLEEVAGISEADSLPRNASFDEGVHNMEILAAVAKSAADNGKTVTL